jgi:hypothetical protein
MVQIENLPLVLTGLGLIASILYYTMTLRNANKTQKQQLETRQAQLFMPLHSTYYSDEYLKAWAEIMKWEYKDYDDYMSKYGGEANPDAYLMYRKVFGYLEGTGVLVKRGLIDPYFVDDLMSGMIVSYWDKFKPIILERRRRLNWPQVGEQIEYLYNQIKPIAEKQRQEIMKDPQ